MKAPKEPKTFKHPRLYWRPLCHGFGQVVEMIIIYPDGRPAERTYGSSVLQQDCQFHQYTKSAIACWNKYIKLTPQQQIKTMKKYAKSFGYETVFIGEIK